MKEYKFDYKDINITYNIKWKRVKNINLRIKPNLEIYVSAPKNINEKVVVNFIQDKKEWIYKSLKKIKDKKKSKLEYKNGDKLQYLGKSYKLYIKESNVNEMKLYKGKFIMHVKNKNDIKLKENLYCSWLRIKSKIIFKNILEKMYKNIRKFGVKYPKMTIRKMKTRWGSCSVNKQKINLNLHLIKAPKSTIEYVILHELVHFLHNNHSEKFYKCIEKIMPRYKQEEKILKKIII
ncbi:MAG: M48 family metallopeptidase [Fusobacteriota bacterium]